MVDYTHFWNEPRPNLAVLLRGLEGILVANSAGLNASVTRDHGDQPEINVRWGGPDGIRRAAQVIVEPSPFDLPSGYAVRIVGSAWMDIDRSGMTSEGPLHEGSRPVRERLWFTQSSGNYQFAGVGSEGSLPKPDGNVLNEIMRMFPFLAGITRDNLTNHAELPNARTLAPGGIFVPAEPI